MHNLHIALLCKNTLMTCFCAQNTTPPYSLKQCDTHLAVSDIFPLCTYLKLWLDIVLCLHPVVPTAVWVCFAFVQVCVNVIFLCIQGSQLQHSSNIQYIIWANMSILSSRYTSKWNTLVKVNSCDSCEQEWGETVFIQHSSLAWTWWSKLCQ